MKFGMTRWKMVPSYSGVLCLVTWLTGFFQSFVPLARPMKFATVSGVCFSNNVQRILPAVVSMTATGLPEVVGAAPPGFAAGCLRVAVWAVSPPDMRATTVMVARDLGMESPLLRFSKDEFYDSDGNHLAPWDVPRICWLTRSTSRIARSRLPPRI